MRAKGLELLSGRVKALRLAVRLDNFRLAHRLRMGLAAYLRHLEEPLRDDIARLLEISGLWVRNVGDRHQTKRQIQRMILRILPRLKVHSRVGSQNRFSGSPMRQSLERPAQEVDRGERSTYRARRRG